MQKLNLEFQSLFSQVLSISFIKTISNEIIIGNLGQIQSYIEPN